MCLHVIADRLGNARLETAFVRAAGGGANAVHIRTDAFVGRFRPLQRHFHLLAVVAGEKKWRLRHGRLLPLGDQPPQELRNAARMGQIERLLGDVVLERDGEAAVDIGHVLQVGLDQVRIELGRLEDLVVRLEVDDGAVAAEGPYFFQLGGRLAALEGLLPLAAVAADGGDELFGKGIDHR